MKFWFCEGCGRRITEAQIAAGHGRDKKLKGVYCGTCAVGVTTMESLPLTDDEARKLLATEEPKSVVQSRSTGARRSSSRALPAGRRIRSASSSRREVCDVEPARPKRALLLWVAGGAAIVLAVALVAMVFRSEVARGPERKPKAGSAKRNRATTPSDPPDPRSAEPAEAQDIRASTPLEVTAEIKAPQHAGARSAQATPAPAIQPDSAKAGGATGEELLEDGKPTPPNAAVKPASPGATAGLSGSVLRTPGAVWCS